MSCCLRGGRSDAVFFRVGSRSLMLGWHGVWWLANDVDGTGYARLKGFHLLLEVLSLLHRSRVGEARVLSVCVAILGLVHTLP